MAEQVVISQIRAVSLPAPVKVRVLRKWVIYKRRKWGSYLLIDNHGDTIHALYRLADEAYLDNKIVLMSCYVFDDYVCQNAPTIMRVAAHTSSIKIDAVTTITAVEDDNAIPRSFFRFTPHEELSLRMEKVDVLTDFIARVESIEHVETQFGNSLLRLTVQGLSGDPIVVALWREIAALVDVDALAATDKPVIVALASVKVIDFHGDMQLESTAATRVEINPDIEMAHELAARYHMAPPADAPRVTFTPQISDRERRTLAAIYQDDVRGLFDIMCTCEATVTEITKDRSWYFVRCLACKRTILPQGNTYTCPRHGTASLKYRYSVNCVIEDGTGKAYVTVFDEPMTTMLGTRCYDMITREGYFDAAKTPDPLLVIRGMRMIFKLQKGEVSRDNILKFVVNKVFHPSTDIDASSSAAASVVSGSIPLVVGPSVERAALLQQPLIAAAAGADALLDKRLMLAPVTPAKTAAARQKQAQHSDAAQSIDEEDTIQKQDGSSSTKRSIDTGSGFPAGKKKSKGNAQA
ncbi:hypothetical protein SSX86_031026 [Deinandra increscens subsp. villosa]|uniref:Replication factor A C-terminal domain-containing protein n=1 Tax=Deinandra increscens subsp. villosa TaxID=3103831 RepID=A0AAP0C5K9_9ASTR